MLVHLEGGEVEVVVESETSIYLLAILLVIGCDS
jgi:hypothetical protein